MVALCSKHSVALLRAPQSGGLRDGSWEEMLEVACFYGSDQIRSRNKKAGQVQRQTHRPRCIGAFPEQAGQTAACLNVLPDP
jgi:hypothetical protein